MKNINNFKYTYSNDNYVYVLSIKNNNVFIKRINNENKINVNIYSFNYQYKIYNVLSNIDKNNLVNDIFDNIKDSIITGYLNIEKLMLFIQSSYTNYKYSLESNNNSNKTLKLELT